MSNKDPKPVVNSQTTVVKSEDEVVNKVVVSYEEKRKQTVSMSHSKTRYKAIEIVSKGENQCENCGCDFKEILQINHKNNDGTQERQTTKYGNGWTFYYDIVKGRRKIDDLNILCRVCNLEYWLQDKYSVKYKILYEK